MFCINCGAKVDNEATFCNKCGFKLTNPGTDISVSPARNITSMQLSQQMTTRQESINEINRILAYFSKKKDFYDEYDYLQNILKSLSRPVEVGSLVWGMIITIIGGYVLAQTMLVNFLENKDLISMGSIFGIVLSIFGFLLLFIYIVKNKKRKKIRLKSEARLIYVTNVLNENYRAFGPCIIGPEYTNPIVLNALRQLLVSGRVDTPKEAINTMLDDAHKTQMQIQAELQTKALKSIKISSAIGAAGSVATAAFCGSDLVGGAFNSLSS